MMWRMCCGISWAAKHTVTLRGLHTNGTLARPFDAAILITLLGRHTMKSLHAGDRTMSKLQGGNHAHAHVNALVQHDAAHDQGLDHDHIHSSSSNNSSTSHSLHGGALAVSLAAAVKVAVVSSNTTQLGLLGVIGGTVLQHAVTRHQ
jgi:hypothetical protein